MIWLLATVALYQTATAPPEIVTGADVVRVCRGRSERDRTYCYAYITGVNDAASDISDAADQPLHCLPERISVGQVAREVSAFLSIREDLWSSRAGGSVVVALTALYPCEGSTFGE